MTIRLHATLRSSRKPASRSVQWWTVFTAKAASKLLSRNGRFWRWPDHWRGSLRPLRYHGLRGLDREHLSIGRLVRASTCAYVEYGSRIAECICDRRRDLGILSPCGVVARADAVVERAHAVPGTDSSRRISSRSARGPRYDFSRGQGTERGQDLGDQRNKIAKSVCGSRENYDAEGESLDALLMHQIAVDGHEDVNFTSRRAKEFAVRLTRPARFRHRDDVVR